jgi:ankyrin repeat protein
MVSKILDAVYRGRHDELAALLAARPALTIFEAAAVGDAARIRELVRAQPALVRQYSEDGWTALHLAAHFGHVSAVEALLATGAAVTAWAANSHRNQPLHAAVAGRGDARVVTALLAARASATAADGGGYTALHLAAFRGDLELVEMLLAYGADPRRNADDGKTALMLAEQEGHDDVARRLRGEEP